MAKSPGMQALVVERPDGPFVLKQLLLPHVGNGQVLVRIEASGVNPLDIKIRAGNAAHAQVHLPATLGLDFAGTVESVGPNVTAFAAGDEVYGMAGGIGTLQGTLATHMVADADLLALRPKNLSARQAAAIPLVFITAWEGLVDRARVHAGQKALIHAGAGGVGNAAVQIAHAFAAQVFATASADKMNIVEAYGATPINYQVQSVDEYLAEHTGSEGFDVVYDTVGGSTLDDSFLAAKTYTGHVVSCLGWGTHKLAPLSFRAATYSGVFTLLPMLTGKGRAHHGEILREATKLAETGRLAPLLSEKRFTFNDVHQAHDAVASGKTIGKVVVEIDR